MYVLSHQYEYYKLFSIAQRGILICKEKMRRKKKTTTPNDEIRKAVCGIFTEALKYELNGFRFCFFVKRSDGSRFFSTALSKLLMFFFWLSTI